MEGKKKILIVSSYCFEKASANGLCARSLYEDLLSHHDTYLLGIGEGRSDGDREYCIEIESSIEGKTTKPYVFSRRLLAAKKFIVPSQNDAMIQSYYNKVRELDELLEFDIIVAMFFPPEIVTAVSNYKKVSKRNFKYIIYELDSYTDGVVRNTGIKRRLIENAKIRWTKKQYAITDLVIVMESYRKEVEKKYHSLLSKIEFADLPLLCDNTGSARKKEIKDIQFLYTGELNKEYRSPEKLLKIIKETQNNRNWHFDFFTKGDCESMMRNFAKNDQRLEMHGYVSRDIISDYYSNADFLISIGNACSNSMPSKTINYISTGKPIIHICLQDNDVAAELLKQYPLALVISNKMNEKDGARAFEKFVCEEYMSRVHYENICKVFFKSSPEYSRRIIESV